MDLTADRPESVPGVVSEDKQPATEQKHEQWYCQDKTVYVSSSVNKWERPTIVAEQEQICIP